MDVFGLKANALHIKFVPKSTTCIQQIILFSFDRTLLFENG
jgi:hypothetical protein